MAGNTLEKVTPLWQELTPSWTAITPAQLRALRRRMGRISARLASAYGTPKASLGNHPDPLDEAVYIQITYQTDVARAQLVWRALRSRFPTWDAVARAPAASLETVLRPAGFQRARARIIQALLTAVVERFAAPTLDPLRTMSTPDAERLLSALPGMEIKGARCVLMYSLDRPVFPVDSNAYRFMQRYGVLRSTARYRRRATHDELQALVAPADRMTLHVNLIVHGQRTCAPREPHCDSCPVRMTCDTGRGLRNARTRA